MGKKWSSQLLKESNVMLTVPKKLVAKDTWWCSKYSRVMVLMFYHFFINLLENSYHLKGFLRFTQNLIHLPMNFSFNGLNTSIGFPCSLNIKSALSIESSSDLSLCRLLIYYYKNSWFLYLILKSQWL